MSEALPNPGVHSVDVLPRMADDIIIRIFSYLDGFGLAALEKTCSHFQTLLSDDEVWRNCNVEEGAEMVQSSHRLHFFIPLVLNRIKKEQKSTTNRLRVVLSIESVQRMVDELYVQAGCHYSLRGDSLGCALEIIEPYIVKRLEQACWISIRRSNGRYPTGEISDLRLVDDICKDVSPSLGILLDSIASLHADTRLMFSSIWDRDTQFQLARRLASRAGVVKITKEAMIEISNHTFSVLALLVKRPIVAMEGHIDEHRSVVFVEEELIDLWNDIPPTIVTTSPSSDKEKCVYERALSVIIPRQIEESAAFLGMPVLYGLHNCSWMLKEGQTTGDAIRAAKERYMVQPNLAVPGKESSDDGYNSEDDDGLDLKDGEAGDCNGTGDTEMVGRCLREVLSIESSQRMVDGLIATRVYLPSGSVNWSLRGDSLGYACDIIELYIVKRLEKAGRVSLCGASVDPSDLQLVDQIHKDVSPSLGILLDSIASLHSDTRLMFSSIWDRDTQLQLARSLARRAGVEHITNEAMIEISNRVFSVLALLVKRPFLALDPQIRRHVRSLVFLEEEVIDLWNDIPPTLVTTSSYPSSPGWYSFVSLSGEYVRHNLHGVIIPRLIEESAAFLGMPVLYGLRGRNRPWMLEEGQTMDEAIKAAKERYMVEPNPVPFDHECEWDYESESSDEFEWDYEFESSDEFESDYESESSDEFESDYESESSDASNHSEYDDMDLGDEEEARD